MKLARRGVITSGDTHQAPIWSKERAHDPQRIVSIPAGIDEKRFSPEVSGDPLRKELHIEEHDYLIEMFPILRSWKGHIYLLEAFKALREKIPKSQAGHRGERPAEKKISELHQENGLTGKRL